MTDTPSNDFNNLPDNHDIQSRARELFREACANPGPYYGLKLGLARRKALNAGPARLARRVWAPLAGGAVACCALAIGVFWTRPPATPSAAAPAATQASAVAGGDDSAQTAVSLDSSQIDMMQNLDFYRWLAARSTPPAAGSRSAR